eukprot:1812537-Prymnesium_polylepis.1
MPPPFGADAEHRAASNPESADEPPNAVPRRANARLFEEATAFMGGLPVGPGRRAPRLGPALSRGAAVGITSEGASCRRASSADGRSAGARGDSRQALRAASRRRETAAEVAAQPEAPPAPLSPPPAADDAPSALALSPELDVARCASA